MVQVSYRRDRAQELVVRREAGMRPEEVEWLREQILLTAQGVLLAAIVFALMFAACALA